jgi:hypothetical protein
MAIGSLVRHVFMLGRAHNEARTDSALARNVGRVLPTIGSTTHAAKLVQADNAFIIRGAGGPDSKQFEPGRPNDAPSEPTRRKTLPGGEVVALSLTDNRENLPAAEGQSIWPVEPAQKWTGRSTHAYCSL